MQTKRQTGIKVDYDTEAKVITWTDLTGAESAIVLNVAGLSEEVRSMGMYHGLDQKCTDAGAMGFDHWDGKDKPKRSATTGERMARIRRVAENLTAGNWNVRASADPLAGKSAEQLEALIAEATKRLKAVGVNI